ncbi:hypothetical protein G0Q06_11205 [Puniceicoccales bacterium CK1056]|uniref:Uncharacterized protein n=1 Tax=Oceanipulchritudo coccoides TaxID=2706888 RepID=A0A6B2M1Z1_9BACT|nr:hypothetical protein [Oceanipulchritudo coccoides]NDV63021.1 hypothetical protein [Oceanipulchritudo coccoides]
MKSPKSKGTLSNRDGSASITVEEFDRRFDAGDPSIEQFLDPATTCRPELKKKSPKNKPSLLKD